jgi:drug/metabolite transporter (DMT)-like permease
VTTPRWQLLLAYAAVYFIWGGSYLALRFAVETIPPALAMGPRNLVGGIVLLGCALAFRTAPLERRQLVAAIAVGLIYFTLSHGLLATAQQRVSSGAAALIFALVPLWIVLLDWAAGRRGPTPGTIGGLALGLAGVGVLVWGRGSAGAVDPFWGVVTTVAGMAWALGAVVAVRTLAGANPVRCAGVQLLSGGAALTLYGWLAGDIAAFDPAQVSLRSALGAGYLLLLGTFVSFVAFTWLMAREPPARVATYAFVNPAVAVLLGWMFAGEAMTATIAAAMAMIVVSVALVVLEKRRPA